MPESKVFEINGWSIFAHLCFIDQLNGLIAEVENLREKNPKTYTKKNATKILAAIAKIAFENIPQDPTSREFRQGNTLGSDHKHWFRAKFFQQYRLFFRFHTESKIIVLAWVNDESTLRAYGSNTDAYNVFKKMLGKGNPPDSWDALLKSAQNDSEQFKEVIDKINK